MPDKIDTDFTDSITDFTDSSVGLRLKWTKPNSSVKSGFDP
ncbi:hypothetical protein [Azospirillum argentinense]